MVPFADTPKIYQISQIKDLFYCQNRSNGEQHHGFLLFCGKRAQEPGRTERDLRYLFLLDETSVDGGAYSMALSKPMSDYEDAVLAVCSAREGGVPIARKIPYRQSGELSMTEVAGFSR